MFSQLMHAQELQRTAQRTIPERVSERASEHMTLEVYLHAACAELSAKCYNVSVPPSVAPTMRIFTVHHDT